MAFTKYEVIQINATLIVGVLILLSVTTVVEFYDIEGNGNDLLKKYPSAKDHQKQLNNYCDPKEKVEMKTISERNIHLKEKHNFSATDHSLEEMNERFCELKNKKENTGIPEQFFDPIYLVTFVTGLFAVSAIVEILFLFIYSVKNSKNVKERSILEEMPKDAPQMASPVSLFLMGAGFLWLTATIIMYGISKFAMSLN